MDFPVKFGARETGRVQVLREGLYYRVICRCRMTGTVVCRLTAVKGDRREPIGVVVPAGDGFALDKKVPVKNLHPEGAEFQLIPTVEPRGERFAPIRPEEPFQYIEMLKDAYLVRREGEVGILVSE